MRGIGTECLPPGCCLCWGYSRIQIVQSAACAAVLVCVGLARGALAILPGT